MTIRYAEPVLPPGRGPARRSQQKAPEYEFGPQVDQGADWIARNPSVVTSRSFILIIFVFISSVIGHWLRPMTVWRCSGGSEEVLPTSRLRSVIGHRFRPVTVWRPWESMSKTPVPSIPCVSSRASLKHYFFEKRKIKNLTVGGIRTGDLCVPSSSPSPLCYSPWLVIHSTSERIEWVCASAYSVTFFIVMAVFCHLILWDDIFSASSVVCPPSGSK